MGLSAVVHTSPEEKFRFLFNSFDRDGSGTIDIMELIALLETGWKQHVSCVEYFDEVSLCLGAGLLSTAQCA